MSAWTGNLDASALGSELTQMEFLIRQVAEGTNHVALVQVQAVTNNGGVSPVGFVDVLPMVKQIDGAGQTYAHGVLHHLPYFRLQGGANAVILDPQAGDIGLAVFADRDSSAAIETRNSAPPGSRRRNDWADGFYLGGFINGVPTQYIAFASGGITITSPGAVTINAPLVVNGTVSASGDVKAGSISLMQHIHPDAQGGYTGGPQG